MTMMAIPNITASQVSAPPGWALLERQLIDLMNESADMVMQKHTERSGTMFFADDVDDQYEQFQNWGLFYAMGGDQKVLDYSLRTWNATTRWGDDSVFNRPKYPEYWHGDLRDFEQQIHNEYYNLATPGGADWHHMGEGNMQFYDFGVADPTISENVRRSRRFAAMFIGEDPEADNYDPKYKIFRSPIQTSVGPYKHGSVDFAKMWLQGGGRRWKVGWYPDQPVPRGLRSSLYPVVKNLEPNWFENWSRRKEILRIFDHVILDGDVANSLAAAALMTNAYLYTGDPTFKEWVIEYVEGWMDRIEQNGGIIPDNVGPTGKIGEHREGQWWGGLYGWNYYMGYNVIFHGATIAAECAQLLTGDDSYVDLLRSQIKVVIDQGYTREDGQMIVPSRRTADGWDSDTSGPPKPMRMLELAHLYHMSMSKDDYQLIAYIRDGDVIRSWTDVPSQGEKNDGLTETARFNYYDGKLPNWPEKALSADYALALRDHESLRNESRDPETLIVQNASIPSGVYTKVLTQVTMGAPQSVYCGGLLRALVRYFDITHSLTLPLQGREDKKGRPGLPEDVAALVDEIRPDGVGVQLVNTSSTSSRSLIVQAGAFGEHEFTTVRYRNGESLMKVPVDGKHFSVTLSPSTSIRLDLRMNRFANDPSYAFPWHGDRIPVPFQT